MGNLMKKEEIKKETKLDLSLLDKRPKQLSHSRIIFVVGGPGSGKGTQCQLIASEYDLLHISTGELLRDEIVANTERGAKVKDLMSKGDLVPLEIVMETLKEAMLHEATSTKGFLIDGYPREVNQGLKFEAEIASVDCVVYFRVSDETMRQRLILRGESSGRSDDKEEAINNRIESFHTRTQPVIDHYEKLHKLLTIEAEGTVDEVFQKILKSLPNSRPPSPTPPTTPPTTLPTTLPTALPTDQ